MRLLSITILFITLTLAAKAQDQSMEQLGLQYYMSKEYEKAADVFKDLLQEQPQSNYYYGYYLNSLLALNRLDEAAEAVKKQMRKTPDYLPYFVDLGYVYSLQGDSRKKEKQYQAALKNLKATEQSVYQLANAFLSRQEFEFATITYLEGRKLLGSNTLFAYSLAELYRIQKKIREMMIEYLLVLEENPGAMESVQNRLQDDVQADENYVIIKEMLLTKIQTTDYSPEVMELLTWLFIQKKEFAEAFRQQKAMDKRSESNNAGMVRLADICIANQAYDVADEIYQYILDKGSSSPYYYHAKFGQIDVKYLKIMQERKPTDEELLDIENLYTQFLNNDFYRHLEVSEKVLLRLSEIKAIYLKKTNEAIALLVRYLSIPQLTPYSKAKLKLALGDYYALAGDVWEATLLYLQVSKDFPDHPLGHEAKFRNARLSFFRGDFDWANTQLDVLKASTSELIANDALRLALLIQDNIGFDSVVEPLQMYAKAEFYIFKNIFDTALVILNNLIATYPSHSLVDNALFAKAAIAEKEARYKEAVDLYTDIFTKYPHDLLADVSLYKAALLCEEQLKDYSYASELYQKIIFDYPDSVFTVDSRKRYRAIKGIKPGT